jgi:hypothetical protein
MRREGTQKLPQTQQPPSLSIQMVDLGSFNPIDKLRAFSLQEPGFVPARTIPNSDPV